MSSYYASPTTPLANYFQGNSCSCIIFPKLGALAGSAAFAGAALFINCAEHPARLSLDNPSALKQWKGSYNRAMPLQAGLAALSGALGIAVAYRTQQKIWLLGACLILANWPFTIICIKPLNQRLLATSETVADSGTRAELERWGKLHAVRTLLAVGAVAVFGYAMFAEQK